MISFIDISNMGHSSFKIQVDIDISHCISGEATVKSFENLVLELKISEIMESSKLKISVSLLCKT